MARRQLAPRSCPSWFAAKESPMALRLLIVDDNRDNTDCLAMLLQREGFEIMVAYDGTQAMEVASYFRPDVFIVDLIMPIMDGFDLTKRLRAMPEFEHSMFVALTGYTDQTRLDAASRAQFDEYLVKPAELKLLLAILSEVSWPDSR
jgi:CheY-like chemotaxis protein